MMTGSPPTSPSQPQMNPPSLSDQIMSPIAEQVLSLYHQRFTGEVKLNDGSQEWSVFLYSGWLQFATGGRQRVRRWFRYLKTYGGNLDTQSLATVPQQPWEYSILTQAARQQRLSAEQIQQIISASSHEVFFNILRHDRSFQIQCLPISAPPEPVALLGLQQLLEKAQQERTAWMNHNLSLIDHELTPVLANPSLLQGKVYPETYATLTRLLNGQNTFWDVAVEMRRQLVPMVRTLLPFISKGLIVLQPTLDLKLPVQIAPPQAAAPPPQSGFTIVCIDDSPAVGSALEKILAPEGHQVLKILDPLHAVSTLLRAKPDLIFLDLLMPNTNGYELCSFLRKTTVFKDTPIVILTGQDGIVDRIRARLVGSTDFIAKPPRRDEVLAVIRSRLGSPSGSASG